MLVQVTPEKAKAVRLALLQARHDSARDMKGTFEQRNSSAKDVRVLDDEHRKAMHYSVISAARAKGAGRVRSRSRDSSPLGNGMSLPITSYRPKVSNSPRHARSTGDVTMTGAGSVGACGGVGTAAGGGRQSPRARANCGALESAAARPTGR